MASTATTIVSPRGSETTLSRSPSIGNNEQVVRAKEGQERTFGDSNPIEEASLEEPDDVEYPTGFRLVAVVVALVLSIFLVALDMVSRRHYSSFRYISPSRL